jgi:hypothetical protein
MAQLTRALNNRANSARNTNAGNPPAPITPNTRANSTRD